MNHSSLTNESHNFLIQPNSLSPFFLDMASQKWLIIKAGKVYQVGKRGCLSVSDLTLSIDKQKYEITLIELWQVEIGERRI